MYLGFPGYTALLSYCVPGHGWLLLSISRAKNTIDTIHRILLKFNLAKSLAKMRLTAKLALKHFIRLYAKTLYPFDVESSF